MPQPVVPLYQAFGNLVRLHRTGRRITQEQLGEKIGLSRTSITNIEKGRQHVPLHQLFALADALRVPPEALLPSAVDGEPSSWLSSKLPPDTDKALVDWASALVSEPNLKENS